jgi:tetratricopeptide (TPR) repeat protein
MSFNSGCSPEQLFEYAFGDPDESARAAMHDHVASCGVCDADLRAIREIDAGGGDRYRATGKHKVELTVDHLARIRALSDLDAAQRASAARLIDMLRGLPVTTALPILNKNRELMTPALAWALMDDARRVVYSDPRLARPLYDLATYVADFTFAQGAIHSQELRVEAWKNLAWVQAFVGEYALAEYALDWAEDAANQCRANRSYMLAIVNLMRGVMLMQMDRDHEALPLIVAARQSFRRWRDAKRANKAAEQEANIRMRIGDARGAVELLAQILTDPEYDELTRARHYQSFAHCLERVGALWSAGEWAERARSIHRKHGVVLMYHKDTWLLARILAKAKRMDEAFELFRQASTGFSDIDAADFLIGVYLDWSEIEIEHGEPSEATYARLRQAATFAIEKRLAVAKCRALDALQQLGRSVTAGHVRRVSAFIETCSTNPHAIFPETGLFS